MSSKVEPALKYLAKGFCPIPVHDRDCEAKRTKKDGSVEYLAKKPKLFTWLEYKDTLPTERQVTSWFSAGASKVAPVANCPCETSIALICGHGGLGVVDIDDSQLMQKVIADFGDETLMVKTKKGMHLWFNEMESSGNAVKFGGIDVDIRGYGGYAIVPPSKHYSFMNQQKRMVVPNTKQWVQEFFQLDGKQIEDSNKPHRKITKGEMIGEGERDIAMYKYACQLVSMNTEPKAILDICLGVNATRFDPPLDEETVILKVQQALKHDTGEEEKPKNITSISSTYFEENEPPPIKWYAEGLLVMEGINLINAKEGSYKTFFMMELIRSRGGKFLGQFYLPEGKTLFLDGESGRNRVHRRHAQLAKGMGGNNSSYEYAAVMGRKLDTEMAKEIEVLCKDKGCDSFIIDPYRMFMGGDEDKSEDVERFLSILRSVSEYNALTSFILHHNRKNNSNEEVVISDRPPTTADIRGSTGLSAHVDCILQFQVLNEKSFMVWQTKMQDDEKLTPFRVDVRGNKEEGWIQLIYGGEREKVFSKEEQAAHIILNELGVVTTPMAQKLLIEKLMKQGIGDKTSRVAIEKLSSENVIRCEKDRNDKNKKYCWIPKEDDPVQQEMAPKEEQTQEKEMSIDDINQVFGG